MSDTQPTGAALAIAALDRLTAAMARDAPEAELALLREDYQRCEQRALAQLDQYISVVATWAVLAGRDRDDIAALLHGTGAEVHA